VDSLVCDGKDLAALEFITSIGDQHRNGAAVWVFSGTPGSVNTTRTKDAGPAGAQQRNTRKTSVRRHWIRRRDGPRPAADRESLYNIDRLRRPLRNTGSGINLSMRNGRNTRRRWKQRLRAYGKRFWAGRESDEDNFFEAGGTSLKAVQVIAMIKKELNKTCRSSVCSSVLH